jgi:two-component system, LuxR family, sensor kinase FixL
MLSVAEQTPPRLADRREPSGAVQRRLDDHKQLPFTSRQISAGEMATTLAHELNQPIGATANLLRGLRSRLARRSDGLNADEAAALDRAIEQVMFAARVIARIREFTHTNQPRHTRVDLGALLRSSASLLDADLRRTGARLSLQLPEADVSVRGDEVMLQQVVVNLMRNALDALCTDPPDAPSVVLRLLTRPNEVEIQVCDNGCGLDDAAAAKLFVPFASNKPSGMGIGLSICRSYVELHQGRLWFSRNADRGATFHVSLPLLAAKPPSTLFVKP